MRRRKKRQGPVSSEITRLMAAFQPKQVGHPDRAPRLNLPFADSWRLAIEALGRSQAALEINFVGEQGLGYSRSYSALPTILLTISSTVLKRKGLRRKPS